MLRDPLALAGLLAGLAALGFWLEAKFAWARQLGASLLIILMAALLSNLGLVPARSPVYDVIGGPLTSLAIVWLLLAVDLRDLRLAGPRMLGAFGLAVAGTIAGTLTASLLVGPLLGDDAWRLAGVMTGTYAGGSLNFVAVGREVQLPEAMFTAATAADNVLTTVWIGMTLMLPLWLRRGDGARRIEPRNGETEGDLPENPFLAPVPLVPRDLLVLVALGFAIASAADALGGAVGGPSVVWLTTLALLTGQLPAIRRLSGALPLGLIALNLFFAVIGIASRIAEIFKVGPAVLYFTAIVVGVHGLIVFTVARFSKLDVETAAVASQAAVGGPSTAVALAAARGWRDLALPGLVVGLLGYAVGTYAGIAVAALVRGW